MTEVSFLGELTLSHCIQSVTRRLISQNDQDSVNSLRETTPISIEATPTAQLSHAQVAVILEETQRSRRCDHSDLGETAVNLSSSAVFEEDRREDMSEPETRRSRAEDPEHTDQMEMKEESEELHDVEEESEEESEETSDFDPYEEDESEHPSEEESEEELYEKSKNASRKTAQKAGSRSPLTCDQCGRSFTSKPSLKAHQRIHTGERPFTCDLCGKSLRYRASLRTHMRIHRGEKPFSCLHCTRAFTHRICYNNHLLSHSSARPFACTQCGKSFKNASDLKKHEVIHSEVKPYHCASCERSFAHPSTLRRHLKSFIHNKYKPLEKLMLQYASSGHP